MLNSVSEIRHQRGETEAGWGETLGWRAEASRRTPGGLGPHSEGRRGLERGTSQALEECELPDRMKEGRNGVRARAAARPAGATLQNCRGRKPGGGVPRLQRPERSWGQRESSRVSDSAGWGAPQAGRLGTGRPY